MGNASYVTEASAARSCASNTEFEIADGTTARRFAPFARAARGAP
jgi:hypothetical protein